MSSAYHPQTDRQSEGLNRCLEMYLRCLVFHAPKTWVTFLPWAEFWYNTSFHSSIGMTPFKVVYGREPPSVLKLSKWQDVAVDVQDQLRDRDAILDILKFNLQKAQARTKHFADRKRTEVHLNIGEYVFVKLQHHCQHLVQLRRNQKVSLKYFGPFQIIEKIGSVAYKLQLPLAAKIHPVFHVSFLKRCEGSLLIYIYIYPYLSYLKGKDQLFCLLMC